MPSPIRRATLEITTTVRFHDSAASLLSACQSAFKARERDANIIYPFAVKSKYLDSQSPTTSRPHVTRRNSVKAYTAAPIVHTNSDTETEDEDASVKQAVPSQFWLSLWTNRGRQSTLDLVLSCTKGPIGDYPIFLYSNVSDEVLTFDWIKPRIDFLISRLRSCVSSRRVFSVFGPSPLTKVFVSSWSAATSSVAVTDPYYAATHTYCTRDTLNEDRFGPLPSGHELRLAEMIDLRRAADLCYGFAAGSDPFVLSQEDALLEARGMIQAHQMFMYNIASQDGTLETASIVCVTRTSGAVAAITKVYTNPNHRGKGYAERLTRHVCQHLLFVAQKNSVVLFVAHDNKAAEKVYHRVGFTGLCGSPRPEGVNDWIEIGFEDTDLGHW